jgi:hypothetical protein
VSISKKYLSVVMIKKFQRFVESISGTELVGPMGPNYGNTQLKHKPNSKDINVIYSEIFGKVVTEDEYQDLYNQYLKSNGNAPLNGFNLQNLETVLSKLNESINTEDISEYFLDLSDLGARIEFDEDFDGNGTPCVEIELIGGWSPYKNDDVYQFILDIHKISEDLETYYNDVMLKGFHAKRESKLLPLLKKIKISPSNYTKNQFQRLEDIHGLTITDITFSYSEYADSPSYPMFRIKFEKNN